MAAKERAAHRAWRRTVEDVLVPPHGGALIQASPVLAGPGEDGTRLDRLPAIDLSEAERDDLALLACGAYSPLPGFMDRETYESVRDHGRLPDGLAWAVPVVLAAPAAEELEVGRQAMLRADGVPIALLHVRDIYPWDPAAEASAVYADEGADRPGFEARARKGARYLIGGVVRWLEECEQAVAPVRTPSEVRALIAERGWKRVGAIVLATPWRRTDEYALRCALEMCDGLIVLSAGSREQDAGLPAKALALASQELLTRHLPRERLIELPLPAVIPVRGRRAAVHQAIVAQNYGCASFFYAAEGGSLEFVRTALIEAEHDGLLVRGIPLAERFHCEACGGIATERSCAHEPGQRLAMPDGELRDTLLAGLPLPPIVARPEIARSLARTVAASAPASERPAVRHIFPHASEVSRDLRTTLAGHRGCVLWLTGLSGSGKSTIAHRLERDLLLSGHRACVLDGDTLRKGLNSDLGFGEEARRENVRRAAEVARLLLDAGMIVIGSFISPFAAERERVRELIGADFHEVYVEAPLQLCEERDPKGLYRRARAGHIPQFTGISSPYEPPRSPALRLDTARRSVEECVQELLRLLASAGALRPQTRAFAPVASDRLTGRQTVQ